MTEFSIPASAANPHLRAGAAALGVLILTSVHHVYGAVIYDTPWRLHIVHIAIPVAAVIVAALWLGAARGNTTTGRVATWVGIAVILVFPVAMIGFMEGGYNHVLKNAVFFTGGEEAMRTLFPQWLYEPGSVETPNDFVFEATGVAQFPLSVWTAVLAWRTV